jgi:hypothetical protein
LDFLASNSHKGQADKLQRSDLTLYQKMFIYKNMRMSGRRILFWVVLVCAMILSPVPQAKGNALPSAAPATDCQLFAQKCDMGAGCTCPCCQQKGNTGRKCGCRSISISFLPGLPAAGAVAPVQPEFPNYSAVIVSAPRTVILDIFRPPKS